MVLGKRLRGDLPYRELKMWNQDAGVSIWIEWYVRVRCESVETIRTLQFVATWLSKVDRHTGHTGSCSPLISGWNRTRRMVMSDGRDGLPNGTKDSLGMTRCDGGKRQDGIETRTFHRTPILGCPRR